MSAKRYHQNLYCHSVILGLRIALSTYSTTTFCFCLNGRAGIDEAYVMAARLPLYYLRSFVPSLPLQEAVSGNN